MTNTLNVTWASYDANIDYFLRESFPSILWGTV